MSVDRGFVERNTKERTRLQALITRLSDADLARPLPAGWTVAAVLAHVAFWDQRILVLLAEWEKTGSPPPGIHEAHVDWVNDAAKPLALALAPRRAAEMTLAIAEAVDRKIETLSDDLIQRNAAAGRPLSFDRAEHRREHLDEIEAALR